MSDTRFLYDDEVRVQIDATGKISSVNYDGTYELELSDGRPLDWVKEAWLSPAPVSPRAGDTWKTQDGSVWLVFTSAFDPSLIARDAQSGRRFRLSLARDLAEFEALEPTLLFRPES